ncbi:GGDEF domain-containing protein [Paractinoplanes durhamensis]|uniref:GGDEF domain-containing protein n=1 Tax=Paractinoplanes durhamensis TaxID=113563 RepID=A0ABQ3Z7I7_9ACTN|nr:GGDEF domain-containing protein [Actinoplanes durhamensis]GIE05776.1 hypothetical protein Adu01nite_71260 [Actinoplanes durhamensis]
MLLRLNLQSASRSGQPAAVLAVDLERFKEVNDQLGYQQGDLLLRQVAERLSATAPADATVARLGGDDFAVLLPGADQVTAEAAAELLLAELHRTFEIDGAASGWPAPPPARPAATRCCGTRTPPCTWPRRTTTASGPTTRPLTGMP